MRISTEVAEVNRFSATQPSTVRSLHLLRAMLRACVLLAAPHPRSEPPMSNADEEAAIRAVIAAMQDAWNRGDLRGYMEGFANPDVIFVSRGRIQKDWQGTLDHYIADYGGSPGSQGE